MLMLTNSYGGYKQMGVCVQASFFFLHAIHDRLNNRFLPHLT
jgi:hypothetical protein